MRARLAMAAAMMTLGVVSHARQQPPPEPPDAAADIAVRRLSPDSFPELPPAVRTELDRRHCLIPQAEGATGQHNVVQGAFRKAGSSDWAVLCSINRVSRILVFWNGNPRTVDSIASRADRNYLMTVTEDRMGFSRSISVANPDQIRRYHTNYGGPPLPPITHDGIDEGMFETASVVWYWHDGRWRQLQGAD